MDIVTKDDEEFIGLGFVVGTETSLGGDGGLGWVLSIGLLRILINWCSVSTSSTLGLGEIG